MSRADDSDETRFAELKQRALEAVLGPMHKVRGRAIIGYEVGGPVDMHYFPHVLRGTAFVTQDLIKPEHPGLELSQLGAHELIGATRHTVPRAATRVNERRAFDAIELRLRVIFTTVGRYAERVVVGPLDTSEVPSDEGGLGAGACLVFDEFTIARRDFEISGRRFGLLLCIEVHRSEMEFAQAEGTTALLSALKCTKCYPYSDLDRPPIV
jgi:hypothetical protein